MNCSNCQNPVADPTAQQCPYCGLALRQVARPRVTAVASKVPVRARVTIAIDGTGSTGPFAQGAARTVEGILTPVEAKAAAVSCSVFRCGDQDYAEAVVALLEDGMPQDAIAAVKRIEFDGGEDEAETHLLNFKDVLDTITPAGPAERNAFVAITTATSKPLRDGRSAQDLGAEFRARDIIVCVVGQNCDLLKEFVQAADGFFFELSNEPSLEELARVAAKVAASITASLTTARQTTRMAPVAASSAS